MKRLFSMSKMLSATAALATVGALLVTSANDAEAALTMRLTQGANIVTIVDGGAGDLAAATAGSIVFFGPIGDFYMNVDTGQSNPVLTAPFPHMDLSVVATTTNLGGSIPTPSFPATLVVELSQTGFSNIDLKAFRTHWSPTVGAEGTSSLEVFVDLADNLFGTDTSLDATKVADLGPLPPGSSGHNVSGVAPTDAFYSLTIRWTITHLALATTTGNAEVQIPEPGSLALFGLGLLGLGFLARRRTARRLDA